MVRPVITNAALQWGFSLAFAMSGAYFLGLLCAPGTGWRKRVECSLHVVMAGVMVAMMWSWWNALPWWPQLAVFTLGGAWFLFEALLADTWNHAWRDLVHLVMMLAMVWMLVLMRPGSGHQHLHHTGPSMLASGVGIILVALMLVAAVLELAEVIASRRRRSLAARGSVSAMVVMLVAMAGACWSMIAMT